LSDEETGVVVAVSAFRAVWETGPSPAWLADRMGWVDPLSEIERLQRSGLIVANGDQELLAVPEAITAALTSWRDQRARRAAVRPGIYAARMRGSLKRPRDAAPSPTVVM
jgi:hypothetical protein